MNINSGKEREVKFYVSNLDQVEGRLQELGASNVQARVHEINLRFDDANGNLTRKYQVLRLRRDTENRITYKGPGDIEDGVRVRRELEFSVGDFATARALLEALGYVEVVMYEKYRSVYDLGVKHKVHITLDEMPFGHFVEIEGPDGESIRNTAHQLGLDWEKRINDSYMMLFQMVRVSLGLSFRDLSFENFEDISVSAEALGVSLADQAS